MDFKSWFHDEEVKVKADVEALFHSKAIDNLGHAAYDVLKTDVGQVAVAAVKAAEGLASGAEKKAAAFTSIETSLKTQGKSASSSIINMLIELAVQFVNGAFSLTGAAAL